MHAGYDVDLLVRFETAAVPEEACDYFAEGGPDVFDDDTGRPIHGSVAFCLVDTDLFEFELTTAVHEILHVMVLPLPHQQPLWHVSMTSTPECCLVRVLQQNQNQDVPYLEIVYM